MNARQDRVAEPEREAELAKLRVSTSLYLKDSPGRLTAFQKRAAELEKEIGRKSKRVKTEHNSVKSEARSSELEASSSR